MQTLKQDKKKAIKILKKALKTKLSKNEYIRVHAVFLRKKGYSHQAIMDITGKSHDAIKEWITSFNQRGLDGLKNQPLTKPRNFKLTYKQKEEIKGIITTQSPFNFGLEGEFWAIQTLKQLIWQKFKVTYRSPESYRLILKFCGFSYQKVKYQDSRRDEGKIKHEKLRLKKKLKKGVLRMYW